LTTEKAIVVPEKNKSLLDFTGLRLGNQQCLADSEVARIKSRISGH
jgi:hypothetical protein